MWKNKWITFARYLNRLAIIRFTNYITLHIAGNAEYEFMKIFDKDILHQKLLSEKKQALFSTKKSKADLSVISLGISCLFWVRLARRLSGTAGPFDPKECLLASVTHTLHTMTTFQLFNGHIVPVQSTAYRRSLNHWSKIVSHRGGFSHCMTNLARP